MSWLKDLGAGLMLSLYVHDVSWNLTRKEPTRRRGAGVGNGFQTSNCGALVPGIQHAIIAGLVGCLLVGRPLARIRGEEGKDSKEGQELVVLEVQLR